MAKLARLVEAKIQPSVMLGVYWAAFWLLNGLDKFFNGTMEPMVEDGLEKGVILGDNGERVGTLYGFETSGLFGVNRNTKNEVFFDRIGVPENISTLLLYLVAVVEISLAVLFIVGIVRWLTKKSDHMVCTSLAYKASFALFMSFCVVDILIGERIELWEHNTFLLILIVSYLVFINEHSAGGLKLSRSSVIEDRNRTEEVRV